LTKVSHTGLERLLCFSQDIFQIRFIKLTLQGQTDKIEVDQ